MNQPEDEPDALHVVGAAIVSDQGRCLAAQRGPTMTSTGKWEFPGGKVEPRETRPAALMREIREELGLEIDVGPLLGRGQARGANRLVVLDVFLAYVRGGTLTLNEHQAVRWLAFDELESVDWADADRPVLPAVRQALRERENAR
jgi:8-oxo-dGTP diphosphatase